MKPFVTTVLLLVATGAGAEERYDHRGSLGLLLGGSVERKDSANTGGIGDGGWRGAGELGGSIGVGSEGNDLILSFRALCCGDATLLPALGLDLSLYGGYRGYFAFGQWKTFFDLDAALHFTPRATIGPRVGIGLQLDFLPVAGAFAVLGAQIGFGDGIRYGAELMLGFQLRTYVLE